MVGSNQKTTTGEEHGPDEAKDFAELLTGHEIKDSRAEGIARFIARTGSTTVFDDPQELATKLERYTKEIAPYKRRRILEEWFAGRNIAIPEGLLERVELSGEEKTKKEQEEEKKKKIKEGAVWTVDVGEKGMPRIRMIKDAEEPGTTLEEATKAAKQIAKEYGGDEALIVYNEALSRHMPNFKSDFVKSNLAVAWAAARQMDKAIAEGEPADPMDIFLEQMAKIESMKELVGAGRKEPEGKGTISELIAGVKDLQAMAKEGRVDLPSWLSDPGAFIETVQKVAGTGDRGLPEWLSDPLKLYETLQTISGGGKVDETVKTELAGLRKTLETMQEEKHREEIGSLQAQIKAQAEAHGKQMQELLDKMDEVRKPVVGHTEMDILHEVATEGIGVIKTELPGLRRDVREAMAGISLSAPKTPEEREERKRKIRGALEADKKIEEIGRRLFFGES